MRKILIVGGGQSGLQLALSLQENDYDVTLMTVRSSEELYGGRAVSMQILYDTGRDAEREYGLNFWDEEAQPLTGLRITGHAPGGVTAFDWTGRFDAPAQSTDERVKIAVWQQVFEERGGRVLLHGATMSDIDRLALMFDLTVVATGHSGLAEMFPVDTARDLAGLPPMATAIAYVEDSPEHHDQERVGIDIVPGLGYVISWPGYSVNGKCRQFCVTGTDDGPMSRFPRRTTPDSHLTVMLELLREFLPERYAEFEGARLADARAVAMDYSTPLVREPVAHLPSGGSVMGMGDSVVVLNPSLQQDANNACIAAKIYLDAILEHGARTYDDDFMRTAFDRYMTYVEPLTGDVAARLHFKPEYVADFCMAANRHQALADRFANGFNDPVGLSSWFSDEAATRAAIAECERSAPANAQG